MWGSCPDERTVISTKEWPSIVIQGERPQGTKERDPRAQRRETPGHKGMGPQGTKAQSIGRPEGRLVPGGLGGRAPQ